MNAHGSLRQKLREKAICKPGFCRSQDYGLRDDLRGFPGTRGRAPRGEDAGAAARPRPVEYNTVLWHGEVPFLEWTCDAGEVRVRDGADSYFVRNGKIRIMTIHYTVEPA
jgi:hypothetical protein